MHMRHEEKDMIEAREEIDAIKDDLEAGMRGLRKRQRAAIEKARAAVDRKKIKKLRISLDPSGT